MADLPIDELIEVLRDSATGPVAYWRAATRDRKAAGWPMVVRAAMWSAWAQSRVAAATTDAMLPSLNAADLALAARAESIAGSIAELQSRGTELTAHVDVDREAVWRDVVVPLLYTPGYMAQVYALLRDAAKRRALVVGEVQAAVQSPLPVAVLTDPLWLSSQLTGMAWAEAQDITIDDEPGVVQQFGDALRWVGEQLGRAAAAAGRGLSTVAVLAGIGLAVWLARGR